MPRKIHPCFLPATLAVILFLSGCADDDPVAHDSRLGTIVVHPIPASLDAPWALTGPDSGNFFGTGDQTFSEMGVGEYILAWGPVEGWIQPENSTQSLLSQATVTFSGPYQEDPNYLSGFVLLPPVAEPMPMTFSMGSLVESDETPHQVTLTVRFNLAATEVTNGQYVAAVQWAFDQGLVVATPSYVQDTLDGSADILQWLDGEDPQIFFNDSVFSTTSPDRPVVEVTWFGAAAYCDWLSLQEGLDRSYDHGTWSCNGNNPYQAVGYRLPTEAEWEFACRAGTTTHFNTGDCLEAGTDANYDGSHPFTDCPSGPFLGHPAEVGSYPGNGWGLFDMHGNVWEWCNDWYDSYGADEVDPTGAETGTQRVLRGGVWYNYADPCRSAYRLHNFPNVAYDYGAGFRSVRSAP